MIFCDNKENDFETRFTNGKYEGICDAPVNKGGGDAGFRPPELLEAALACCINITLRRYAASQNIPLVSVAAKVNLNRQVPGEAAFEYGVELNGPFTEEQRQALLQAADSCVVHQILSHKISFKRLSE